MADEQLLYKNYFTAYRLNVLLEIKSYRWLIYPKHSVRGYKIIFIYPSGKKIERKDEGTDKNPYWGFQVPLNELGTYRLEYYRSEAGGGPANEFLLSYTFSVVENELPLKKWTITEVINRTLDLAEPLRQGEKPRFRLNGMRSDGTIITKKNKKDGEEEGQAVKFDKIIAPEFSFTKQTLRECLQEVGKFIHGEPRLEIKKEGDEYYYEVVFDMYAGQEKSGIRYTPYASYASQYAIENYACYLDSNAENLINQLDKFGGVIVEPYHDGAKSVRTENLYVRLDENNMLIPTQYPIYSVEKLEFVFEENNSVKSVDITAWLFEKSEYDRLSSFDGAPPYSKAYGIYYAQGNKNINGLNFKIAKAVFEAYENYAIVNIIRQATGNKDLPNTDYQKMCFRITYTPIYNARVAQTKLHYKDFLRPAGLIFNQQSNVIESRYYGENLKGAIARLGNVEVSLTYYLDNLEEIPKAGQTFDKDYYISVVSVEYLPTVMKCTIGLSKDFNRLSSYIGIDSSKRYSEISQTQAVERNVLYREFIVIGDKEEPDLDTVMEDGMLWLLGMTFVQPFDEGGQVTNVNAWGTSYKGNSTGNAVNLPVITSSFGNSISFSWKYEDNYSAGAFVQYKEKAFKDGESAYFQNSVSYTDYYGRVYYYNFDLQLVGHELTSGNINTQPLNLPKGSKVTSSGGIASTIDKNPFILRKDNREALQVNYQIDLVTNKENIIIGSALASYCPAVRGSDQTLKARLYVFPTELNKFTDHIEAYEDVDLETMPSSEIDITLGMGYEGYMMLTAENFPADGKSWAIVTRQYKKAPQMVEDEKGEPYEQKEVYGGDLLIGQNIEVTAGQAFTPIYFTKKREIFNKDVWVNKK